MTKEKGVNKLNTLKALRLFEISNSALNRIDLNLKLDFIYLIFSNWMLNQANVQWICLIIIILLNELNNCSYFNDFAGKI